MAESLKHRLDRYRTEMQAERGKYHFDWQQIDNYLYPRPISRLHHRRPTSTVNSINIINETATFALNTLRSGLMSGYVNPSRPWFKMGLTNPDLQDLYTVKSWLAEVEERLRTVLIKSNFYYQLPNIFGDAAAFGTAALLAMEDDEHIVRFTAIPVGQFLVALDDRDRPECLYRELTMTARQIVERFGAENVSDRVKKAIDGNRLEENIDVTHAILPNSEATTKILSGATFEKGTDGKTRRVMPFHSVYYETHGDDDAILQQKGFQEFPAMCPRWDAITGDVYSTRWPGMTALGSVKQLQATERVRFTVHDLQARPPMLADSTMKSVKTSIVPGGITYLDNLAMSQHAAYRRTFDVNPDTRGIETDIREIEARIKRAYHEDLMSMFATGDYRQMTAREVAERAQEKIFVLGPVMQHFDTELCDPVLFRTVSIMLRNGHLPPVPPELAGQELKIEYTSIMSQALKLIGSSNTETFMTGVAQMAQVFGPTVLDNVDSDHVVTEYGQQQGVSPKVLVPEDQVAAKRKARAQAEQQAQQAQQQQAQQQAMMQGAGGAGPGAASAGPGGMGPGGAGPGADAGMSGMMAAMGGMQ